MGEELPRTNLRFFLGVRETAGYLARLAEGLGELGVHATVVDLSNHPFGYAGRGWWVPPARLLATRRNESVGPARAFWRALQWALTTLVMLWALPKHNVFVLASLPSSAALLTIGLLRITRRRVIVVFSGSDSRPPYLDGFSHLRSTPSELAIAVRRQRRAVRTMERWANVVVSHTASSHFLRRPFVSFLRVGIPSPLPRMERPRSSHARLRIVHAPSHPASKGTSLIRDAFRALEAEGIALELIELIGVPHETVLAQLEEADLVVDQLYSDQPMPGFATEAASLGNAVIIAGYDWDELREEESSTPWPPTIQIRPEELEATLRRLALHKAERVAVGERASAFVANNWTASAVARRFVHLARGDFPGTWLHSPDDIRATHGYGLSAVESRRRIASLVASAGVQALGLMDLPRVESRILDRLDEKGEA